jgi:uncharacterized Zn finger protein
MKMNIFGTEVDTEKVSFVCEECGTQRKVKGRQLVAQGRPVTKLVACVICGKVRWCAIVEAMEETEWVVVE